MNYPSYEELLGMKEKLKEMSISHWYHDDLFTLNWWILLVALILPWIIWLKYRDRKRTFEILSYGLIWAVFAVTVDQIGSFFMLWSYPDNLTPIVSLMYSADVAVIPVSYMFLYQHAKSMKAYVLGSLLISAVYAYIVEHLFMMRGMFILLNWSHTFSFISFFLVSLIIKWIVGKLKQR